MKAEISVLEALYTIVKAYAEGSDSSKIYDFYKPDLSDQFRYNLAIFYTEALQRFDRSKHKEEFSKIEEELEKIFPSTIPEIGNAIVGYKIVIIEYDEEKIDNNGETITIIRGKILGLAKLYIPSDAKRLQSFNNKCRCDRAIVTDIRAKIGNKVFQVKTGYSPVIAKKFYYNVDDYVFPDSYDDNRFNECSHGIHFFMTQKEAIDYALEHLPIYVGVSDIDENAFEGLYEGD